MRVRVGKILLQELKEGELRVLNDEEFQALKKERGLHKKTIPFPG
jgi:hypothetical protein